MASQEIPQSYESLVQLFADAADGARDHGPAVGLKQNTESVLRPELEAITGRPAGPGDSPPALLGLKAEWNAAKSYKINASTLLRVAKADGRALASACVNVLKPRLGNRWSNLWQTAGFTGGSLEISDNPLTVLQQLRAYFTAHPNHEIPDLSPVFSATAAACDTAARAIIAASTAANQSEVAASTAKNGLDAGLRNARKRLGGLRDELSQLLGRDDERWYAFGFDRPNDPQTPDVPEGIRASLGATGSGTVFLGWNDARRAANYRVVVRDSAGHAILERLVTDSEVVLTGLATGQTVQVLISARNGRGGESVPAPAVTVTVA